ncbi:MAG TPA: hypothetical protein VGH73_22810 [Thermoanaerobaculia bacterium]|jgi:hypothetical protein
MAMDEHVRYEASLDPPEAGVPARLYIWVRRFHGNEELTGRYEVFEDLARLDDFIARAAAAGEDAAELRAARDRFAATIAAS